MTALPTYRSKRLGARLRGLREDAGLPLREAASRIGTDQSVLSRIESGKRGTQRPLLTTLLDTYGVTDHALRESLAAFSKTVRQRDWWALEGPFEEDDLEALLTLENDSKGVRIYEPHVLPGIFQTEAYMEHLFASRGDPEKSQHRLQVRLKRKQRLSDISWTYQTIIEASALHRIGGGEELRRGQLGHLLEVGSRRNVTLQVLPQDIAFTPDQWGPFTIFTLVPDWPGDIVWVESLTSGSVMEQTREVDAYRRAWEELSAMALSPPESAQYIATLLSSQGTIR